MTELTIATKIALVAGLMLACLQQPSEAPRPTTAAPSRSHSRIESVQHRIEGAKAKLAAGFQDQAILILREVLRDDPNNSDAHLLLGTALAMVPQRNEAIHELQRAVELRPTFTPGYYALGTALAQFGDLSAAKPMFEKAIELDQNFADAHISLALLLAQSKHLADARAHLEQAISLKGGSPGAAYPHYLLGRVLTEQGELPQALAEFEAATKIDPNYADAYLAKGVTQKTLLQEAQALQSFQRAATIAPDNPEAQYQLGTSFLRADDATQAVEHLDKAARLKPADRSFLYQLCRALRKSARSAELKQCEGKLTALIQGQQTADANMFAATKSNNDGVELEKNGDIANALEKYRAAVALDPYTAVFRRNLGLALCRIGKWKEAIPQLQEVLELNPEDTEATKALYVALDATKTSKNSERQ
jgi:tetratricopeptide (TPR) repeat protein